MFGDILKFNPNPLNIKFRKRNPRKRNFKKKTLIPARRARKMRRKIFKFFLLNPLSSETGCFAKFFFNLEPHFFKKMNFLRNFLIRASFEKFEVLEEIKNDGLGFLEEFSYNLYAKHSLKQFNLSNYNPISLLPSAFRKRLYKQKNFNENPLNNRYLQFYLNGFISF
jgi:hypothetical protein